MASVVEMNSPPGGDSSESKGEAEDGIDASLIRWVLSLSPAERLDRLQANARAMSRLQDAAEAER